MTRDTIESDEGTPLQAWPRARTKRKLGPGPFHLSVAGDAIALVSEGGDRRRIAFDSIERVRFGHAVAETPPYHYLVLRIWLRGDPAILRYDCFGRVEDIRRFVQMSYDKVRELQPDAVVETGMEEAWKPFDAVVLVGLVALFIFTRQWVFVFSLILWVGLLVLSRSSRPRRVEQIGDLERGMPAARRR